MPAWDKCYWLSRAYIEASFCLCNSMVQDDFSNQYSSSRVVLHLARQGLELFLKGSILAATGEKLLPGHNLARLLTLYRTHYPSNEFYLKFPRHFALVEADDLFQNELDQFHSTLDQRHRYPEDRNGEDFATPEVFNPRLFLEEIGELDKQLKSIEFAKIRPGLNAGAT